MLSIMPDISSCEYHSMRRRFSSIAEACSNLSTSALKETLRLLRALVWRPLSHTLASPLLNPLPLCFAAPNNRLLSLCQRLLPIADFFRIDFGGPRLEE